MLLKMVLSICGIEATECGQNPMGTLFFIFCIRHNVNKFYFIIYWVIWLYVLTHQGMFINRLWYINSYTFLLYVNIYIYMNEWIVR